MQLKIRNLQKTVRVQRRLIQHLQRSCSQLSYVDDKVSICAEGDIPEMRASTAASTAPSGSSQTMKHATPHSKRMFNLEDADNFDEFNQFSPKKKRKKSLSTNDGDSCKRCNCKKTKCLKLYCDCFAAGIYCAEPCACQGSFNRPEYKDTVLEIRQLIESRNPLAFAPKIVQHVAVFPAYIGGDGNRSTPSSASHKRGCNCKKSMCLKKYCECYQANVGCSNGCRCEGVKMSMEGKKIYLPQNRQKSICSVYISNHGADLSSISPLRFLLSLFLHLYLNTSNKKLTNSTNRGLKCYPIVGGLPDFLRNRHHFLDWTTEVLRNSPHNTLVYWQPGNVHVIMTVNPLNVEYMLKTNFDNYPKGDHFMTLLQDLVGQGFFNCDGDLWKLQRRTASSEFSTKSLRNFFMDNVKTELSTRLVPILKRASTTQLVMDLQDVFERFAFDNICKLAFNVDADCLGGDASAGAGFMRAFDAATMHSFGRFLHAFNFLWKLKKKFNMGSELVLKQSIAIVHEFADDIIRSRMKTKVKGNAEDLLSRFIAVEEISPKFLRDIILSFMIAGRDTTSSALTWFFWLLSLNPEVELKILNELEMIRARYGKNTGDTHSFEELRDMHYLHAAISESLRLYPPVPIDMKVCLKDDMLPDGTFAGAGWFVTYNAYAMGRMESIWGRNFHEYLPERWLENGIYRPENSFRFSVFHAGPRICLGKDMAYIQIKSVAALVIERFVIKVQDNDECPQHLQSLTLRMKGGLHVKVKERFVDII